MKEFITIKENENLYVDRILFESFYPILFTCKNEFNDTFICVCCQHNSDGIKWLIGKTSNNYIIHVLQDKITIRELLLYHTSDKIIVNYINDEYSIEYVTNWEKYESYLPKEDSYMYAEPGEFDEDIEYLQENEILPYRDDSYKNVVNDISLASDPSFIVDINPSLISLFPNTNMVYSEIILNMQTKKFNGDVHIDTTDIIYNSFKECKTEKIQNDFYNISNTKIENEIYDLNNLTEAA